MIHKSSESSTQSGGQAAPTVGGPDSPMFDMSMDSVPSDWVKAQTESSVPYDEYGGLPKDGHFDAIPTGSGQSSFVAALAATGASLFAAGVWCLADIAGLYSGPWCAVGLGAAIALAVRVSGGADSMFSALLCLGYYLVALTMVLIVLTHRELIAIYGSIDGFGAYEDTLVRTRLQDPVHLAAYAIGALLASQLSYLGNRRS